MRIRRWAIGVVLLFVAAFVVFMCVMFDEKMDRRAALRDAWTSWRLTHCQIISVSAGGFAAAEMIAVRCDDGRDYVQYGPVVPEGWEAK